MGDSGSTHQVGTFSSSADDLHTGGILQVIYTRDCPVTWSTSFHRIGQGYSVHDTLLKSFQKAMGMQLTMSTAFHTQTNDQLERTIQVLEDMLRARVLDFKGSWEEHLPLVKFTHNNSYHASIQMAPYEALYGRPCRSPIYWTEVGESSIIGPDLIRETLEKEEQIWKCLLTA